MILRTLMAAFFSLLFTQVHAETTAKPIAFKGDFRFRTENIKEELVAPLTNSDRTRQRIRLRFGATGSVNENTDVTLRLATGTNLSTDATSTNQDLTDYYAKKNVVLDLAYFNWKAFEGLTVWGGKTPLAFLYVGGNDLILDSDLTPEGFSFKYKLGPESREFFVNASSTWLNERFSATGTTDNTDVGLVSGQIGFNFKEDDYGFVLTVSHYNFSNIMGSTSPSAKGNTLKTGAYANEYKITSAGGEFNIKLADMPLVFFIESASNSEGGDYKAANNYGIKYGKLKNVGSWSVGIDQREVQKDSVVGVLTDSDSSGGGTDIRSLRVSAAYQPGENASIAASFLTGEKSISSTIFSPKYQRAMLDFNFNF